MKVLLIAHACQVSNEGQQRAEQLGRFPDIDLHVITPDRWYEHGAWRTVQVPTTTAYTLQPERVRFPWTGPGQWYLHHYPQLDKVLRKFRPDVIDLWEEAWGCVSAHTCWLRNRLLPQTKIVSETEANIPRIHPPPFRQFRAFTLKNTDYAIARQNEGVEVLRTKGYYGPVDVIGNAVDAELYRPMDREVCKRALGVTGFVVGYVGRFIEAKGLMDMVEAMSLTSAQTTLVFVGSGPYQTALQRRVIELRLQKRVLFLSPRAMVELPAVMNAFDALLLVSHTTATWKEQFGRVIIEAHACETPVIGSNSGAIPEVIGEGGLTVREKCPAELAAAISKVERHPEFVRNMGQAGRRQVEELYTWRRVAERTRDVYLKVTQRMGASQAAI
ncbi:MAG: glycosyltransferase family 4 protein [Rhodospirillales bacterium]|nr:glycosyltransferase family 4 protein [Acetobacter sp.]